MSDKIMSDKLMNTWADVLAFLQTLTPEQLRQAPMAMPPEPDGDKPLGLMPLVTMGTIEEMCHVDGKVVTKTRSCDNDEHHPEQVVMLIDSFPYDNDGNGFYKMEGEGWRGNKTGILYSDEELDQLHS